MSKKIKKEGSAVGNIKGFSAPFGAKLVKRKRSGKQNPSKPYNEPELFEHCVVCAELRDEDIEEVVRQRGQNWVYFDDDTEVQKGSYQSRNKAWDVQRRDRSGKRAREKFKKSERERQKRSLTPTKAKEPETEKSQRRRKTLVRKAKKAATEKEKRAREASKLRIEDHIVRDLGLINEASMISYVFENTPVSEEALIWEKFVSKLSKETVMSDKKLKEILTKMAKSEVQALGNAIKLIGDVLEPTGYFKVKKGSPSQDPETKDIKLGFVVHMEQNKVDLPFEVKIENGRPLILFPDSTRQTLNDLMNGEAKTLRAELVHIQEVQLNKMEEMTIITFERDKYLGQLENKIERIVDKFSLLEIAMLRYLIKSKFKGVK